MKTYLNIFKEDKNVNLKKLLIKKGTELINKKCTPGVLIGFTVTGVVVTGVVAYRSGIKAGEILKKRKEKPKLVTKEEKVEDLKEAVKDLAPIVLPPAVMAMITILCAIGSHKVTAKRMMVLSAAYTVAREALSDQDQKILELFGENKRKKIKDEIAKDRIKDLKVSNARAQKTGRGNQLCKDVQFGTEFYSSVNAIQAAINSLSTDCIDERWVTLDDFYDKLNIDHIGVGSSMGWCSGDLCKGTLPISVTPILNEDSEVVLCLDYTIGVSENFPVFDQY